MEDNKSVLLELVFISIMIFIICLMISGCGDSYEQNCNYSPKITTLSSCQQNIEFDCELCLAHFDDETSGPRCDAELGDTKSSN